MSDLQTMERNPDIKPKKLRREGFVPGCVYGKNFNPSLLIQIPEKDARAFLKANSTGSTVTICYGKKKIFSILKDVTMVPLTPNIEHLTFQELIKGDKVIGTVKFILTNKEHVDGMTTQNIYDVQYKAIPEYLIDEITIDMDGKKIGDQITLEDLPELNNENIELLIPIDSLIAEVKEIFIKEEEPVEEDAVESSEPVVIGEKDKE